jgi:ribosome-associated protein
LVDVLEDKKAEDILLLDLRPDAIVADYFIICNGTSDRQIRALTEYVREAAKIEFSRPPASIEGNAESGWMLMDFGDLVVHIFAAEKRRYYDLEGMWRTAHVLLRIQ